MPLIAPVGPQWPDWDLWRRDKSLSPPGIRTQVLPARSFISVLSTVSRLTHQYKVLHISVLHFNDNYISYDVSVLMGNIFLEIQWNSVPASCNTRILWDTE